MKTQPAKRRPVRVYDNGGETFDRYTVIFTRPFSSSAGVFYSFLGMSANPTHPQGFCQHGELRSLPAACERVNHLGRRIYFNTLPAACRAVVESELEA